MIARLGETRPSPFRSREERDLERIEKREAVLKAAVEMFNARGFHATSLDDLAASLGISKPTIYHYLGNKDQVLLECLTRGLMQLRAAAEEAQTLPGTGLDRLRAFLRSYADVNMRDFGKSVIRTGEEALAPESAERLRDMKREIDAALRNLVRAGIEDKSIAAGDVTMIAFTLAGALNWPGRWYNPAKGRSISDVAEAMVDILTAGLAPR